MRLTQSTFLGRLICLLVGHERDTVWMNMALGLSVENPDRRGTTQDSPEWGHFGGGSVFMCPRCRVIFLPLPDKSEGSGRGIAGEAGD